MSDCAILSGSIAGLALSLVLGGAISVLALGLAFTALDESNKNGIAANLVAMWRRRSVVTFSIAGAILIASPVLLGVTVAVSESYKEACPTEEKDP